MTKGLLQNDGYSAIEQRPCSLHKNAGTVPDNTDELFFVSRVRVQR